MASKYETVGGHVSRGETFAKILDLTDQLLDQCAVMAHLHNTEDSAKDRFLAQGWLCMHHAFKLIRHQLVQLSKGAMN